MLPNPTIALRRFLWALALTAAVLLTLTTPVSAHTGFESSTPSDGDTIDEPVYEILLTFSAEASPAGEGFVVLDPNGSVRIPDEITSSDNLTWILLFKDPLVDGVVGVRWSVAAPDAHPIDGSFSFSISALAPTTIASTTTVPSDAVQTTTTSADAAPIKQVSDAAPAEQIQDDAVAPTDTSNTDQAEETPTEETSVDEADSAEPTGLDEFLDTSNDEPTGASILGGLGRILHLLGAVLAIGGTVFVTFVLRGEERDARAVLTWVRWAGIAIIVGTLIQTITQFAVIAQDWSGLWATSTMGDVLWSSFGLAAALKLVGGLILFFGAQLHTHAATKATFAGAGLVAVAFMFDGHTVSEGPRWLHAIANLVHVVTATTWAGGIAMLALVIAHRRSRGADTRALQLGIRFSIVATVALVAAAITGTVLSIVILDSVSQIWTTPWGRLLILKVVLVGVAATGGAYNHRVLLPELKQNPNSSTLTKRFRTIVTFEALALVAVAITTALLIGASSV